MVLPAILGSALQTLNFILYLSQFYITPSIRFLVASSIPMRTPPASPVYPYNHNYSTWKLISQSLLCHQQNPSHHTQRETLSYNSFIKSHNMGSTLPHLLISPMIIYLYLFLLFRQEFGNLKLLFSFPQILPNLLNICNTLFFQISNTCRLFCFYTLCLHL